MKSDRRVLGVVAVVSAAVFAIFVLLAVGGSNELATSQLIGKPAPRLVAPTIDHGEVARSRPG
ncbi:MAG: hypothetical protein ACC652_05445 [Acidimicrobiales bacterium]